MLFLILGIRENTEVTRAVAYDRNIDSINEQALLLAQDEELAGIFQAYAEGRLDELDSAESYRLQLVVQTLYRIYEKAYFADQYGTLGVSEWSRFDRQICRQFDRANTALWDQVQSVLTEEFASYIVEGCRDNR